MSIMPRDAVDVAARTKQLRAGFLASSTSMSLYTNEKYIHTSARLPSIPVGGSLSRLGATALLICLFYIPA